MNTSCCEHWGENSNNQYVCLCSGTCHATDTAEKQHSLECRKGFIPCNCPTTDTSDTWRERFQEQFVAPPPFEETLYSIKPEYIKAFIEKELESQSAQMTKAFHGELERQIEKAREEEKPWLVQQIHNNAFEAGKEAGREEALSTVKIGRNSEIVIGSPCWRAAMTEGRAAERARLRERIAFLPAPPQWTEQSWHEAKADILNLLKLNLLKGDNS